MIVDFTDNCINIFINIEYTFINNIFVLRYSMYKLMGYWLILNHFKWLKCVLLNDNESEMDQTHRTDNVYEAGDFALETLLKCYLPLLK